MKKYFALLPILFLTACAGNYKVKNIVSFTNELHAEAKEVRITIPKREHVTDCEGDAQNINIDANDLPTKLKFEKLKLSADISARPIIIEDKIIVLCADGSVRAFNSNYNTTIWTMNIQSKKSKNKAFGGGIAYSDGKLYVTNGSQMLEILNPDNGRRIMSKKFPDIIIAPPVIHNNLILLLTLGNQLFAVNKDNGAIIWDHAGTPETLTYGNIPTPTIDSMGRIFVTYSSGQIFLLNPENGSVLWQHDLSSTEHMPGLLPTNVTTRPILEGHNIYLADSLGQFYKFDTKTGHIVWQKAIQDVQTINNVGNSIFITTNGRQAAAIDKLDGKIIWVTNIVDDLSKSKKLAQAEAKKLQEAQNILLQPEDRNLHSKNPFKKIFAKMKEFKSKKKHFRKNSVYDRSNLKPIDFVSGVLMNDLFTLYTSKGSIYYLSPIDGTILDQRNLNTKLSFVAVSSKVVLVSGKKILMSK